MGIDGFPSLEIPLNLSDPAYSVHVSSVFLFYLRVCEKNWPLLIGPHQFLNSSLNLSPGTIKYLLPLDQVKQFILASGPVPDQRTKYRPSSLYNIPHKGAYIFSPEPSTLYDHFITTMVDIYLYGSWLLIVSPSGGKPSICVDFLILIREETTIRLTPSWRQPLF